MYRPFTSQRIQRRIGGYMAMQAGRKARQFAFKGYRPNRRQLRGTRKNARTQRLLMARVPRPTASSGPSQFLVKKLRTYQIIDTPLAASAGYQEILFSPNTISDPMWTTGTAKPKWAIEYATMYNKYRVLSYYLKVKIINASTTVPIHCALVPTNDSTSYTDITQAIENKVHTKVFLPTTANAHEIARNLSMGGQMHKCLKVTRNKYNSEDEYVGSPLTTNPSTNAYVKLCVEPTHIASTAVIDVAVEIVQTVLLYDLKTPSAD